MATFNGHDLWLDNAPGRRSGAVLELVSSPEDDLRAAVDGAEVIAQRGSKAILVRGLADKVFDDCLRTAVDIANKGLDVFSATGQASLSLADAQLTHLVWVDDGSEIDLRVWAVSPWPMPRLRMTIEVMDAQGNVVVSPPAPDPQWHEAFRYFRLAQVTNDLFDAFRNLYLALEALLSTVAPQLLRPDGSPAEGEGKWFRRALTEATQLLEMSRYSAEGQAVATVDTLYDEIYVKTRSAVFHAKAGRPVLIPLDLPSRPVVLETLQRLALLVADLTEKTMGVRFASSSWTSVAFRKGAEAMLRDCRIHLLDDEDLNLDVDNVGRLPGSSVSALGRLEPDYCASFRQVVVGEFAPEDLTGLLPFVASAALADSNDLPLMGTTLEGRLQMGGINRVRVALGVQGINTRILRGHYAT